jgi:uncharacterized YigZ family protein
MLDNYLTVKQEGSFEIIIQKSRFIGHVKRTETEQEAQDFIQEIKKKHNAANHNCSAYMIGENNLIQKAQDDGEPSGTAGVPMLEVLKKKDLKDTTVVVTRYFGGVKLGAGGLIRAYSKGTSEVINHVGIVNRQLMKHLTVTVDYSLIGKLENELRSSSYLLEGIDYLENVTFHVYVARNQLGTFKEWIVNSTSDQAVIKEVEEKYIEIDIE